MTADDQSSADAHARRRRRRRLLLWALAAWAVAAYLVVPVLWKTYFRHHSDFDAVARITTTADGHPGDPVNVALVGSEADVVRAMTAAGWIAGRCDHAAHQRADRRGQRPQPAGRRCAGE